MIIRFAAGNKAPAEMVKMFLEAHEAAPSVATKAGSLPLHVAAACGLRPFAYPPGMAATEIAKFEARFTPIDPQPPHA